MEFRVERIFSPDESSVGEYCFAAGNHARLYSVAIGGSRWARGTLYIGLGYRSNNVTSLLCRLGLSLFFVSLTVMGWDGTQSLLGSRIRSLFESFLWSWRVRNMRW